LVRGLLALTCCASAIACDVDSDAGEETSSAQQVAALDAGQTASVPARAEQPIKPESNPYNMYDRLMFDDGTDPGFREALAKARRRRQSSIDLVRQELQTLSTRIGADDRIKLEQHLEGLLAIERRLDGQGQSPLATPERPKAGIDLMANDSFPEILQIPVTDGCPDYLAWVGECVTAK
jgi:hypothetical protein